jgi:hypothetical protein
VLGSILGVSQLRTERQRFIWGPPPRIGSATSNRGAVPPPADAAEPSRALVWGRIRARFVHRTCRHRPTRDATGRTRHHETPDQTAWADSPGPDERSARFRPPLVATPCGFDPRPGHTGFWVASWANGLAEESRVGALGLDQHYFQPTNQRLGGVAAVLGGRGDQPFGCHRIATACEQCGGRR